MASSDIEIGARQSEPFANRGRERALDLDGMAVRRRLGDEVNFGTTR